MSGAPTADAAVVVEHDVTLDAIVRYAGASGDFTRIHWDAEEASAAGYDRFFAMGMLPAGWLSALLVDTYGAGSVCSFQVRFRSRTWIGERVRCEVRPTGRDDAGRRSVELRATDSTGAVLVEGSAAISRPPAPSSEVA